MLTLATSFSLPVTSSFLELDSPSQTLAPVRETLFDVRIAPLVAAFLFLSAAAHWSLASFGRGWYRDELGRGMNRARWLEYLLSSSLMIVVIALLVRIHDIASLILIAAANASNYLYGERVYMLLTLTAKSALAWAGIRGDATARVSYAASARDARTRASAAAAARSAAASPRR